MIRCVLLDVDGTLVLSNDAHAHSWVEAFARHGYEITFEQVRPLIGMGGDKLIPRLFPELSKDSDPGKKISELRTELVINKYVPDLKPAPGSRELVQHFISQGLRLLAASSAKKQEAQALLKVARVDDILTEMTTSDDADQSKPDPDIVHAALDKINMPAEQVLMIGDTPYDVEAAGRAGIGLVAVRCGGWDEPDLHGALAIYEDPADLLARYAASPFGQA
jgi:HAD superfamily hydrolase (TIGR01509 family)